MTRRPGRIRAEIPIDLPRPRDFYEVRFTDQFRELHQAIWCELAAEVMPPSAGVLARKAG